MGIYNSNEDHTFIGEGLKGGPPHKERNFDDRLFFDILDWGFFYFRENPKIKVVSDDRYFLINNPTTFVSDAKTTILETKRSFWYIINFCCYIEDIETFRFSKEPSEEVLSYRALEEDDKNFQKVSEIVEKRSPKILNSKEKNYIGFCTLRNM